jgi:hypothetical protein
MRTRLTKMQGEENSVYVWQTLWIISILKFKLVIYNTDYALFYLSFLEYLTYVSA